MTGYLVSLAMGLAVGVAYGLVDVHSPAPPLIALVGLLGMVLGEHAVDLAKYHLAPPASALSQPGPQPAIGKVQEPVRPAAPR
jgi:XapX domain-containing protein